TAFGHCRGDRSRSRATPSQSGRIPTHEPERQRRLSLPAARVAPPTSSRPFPQSDPLPQSPSSVTSLCRVLACKVAAPSFVAVPCQFHRNCLLVMCRFTALKQGRATGYVRMYVLFQNRGNHRWQPLFFCSSVRRVPRGICRAVDRVLHNIAEFVEAIP